jgi:hypothetical protein
MGRSQDAGGSVLTSALIALVVAFLTSILTSLVIFKSQPIITIDTARAFLRQHYKDVFSSDNSVRDRVWNHDYTANYREQSFNNERKQFDRRYLVALREVKLGDILEGPSDNVFKVESSGVKRADETVDSRRSLYYLKCTNPYARANFYTCAASDVQLDVIVRQDRVSE